MKISLVTVAFNSVGTLADTIESVLRQQYTDYEYLIVDGGSTDGTVPLIQSYEARFRQLQAQCREQGLPEPSFRWISEPDRGLYDGLNKGIRMATGRVVGIINSDDFYHRTDIFCIIAQAFATHPDTQAIYGDVRFVTSRNIDKTVRYYSSARFRPSLFRWGWMPAHPTFFTYRQNFERYGYYKHDYAIAADFELLIRFLLTHHLPATYLPVDFLKMRVGGRSTSGIRANLRINRENARACRENGVWTCLPMLMLRYIVKVFEFLFTRE